MKIDRRWVAGTAALLMAAFLVAMPREGAAGPRRYPEGPPMFGDPEEPSSAILVKRDLSWLSVLRFSSWFLPSNTAPRTPASAKQRGATSIHARAGRHE